MACIFCDQTPETANAVEALYDVRTAFQIPMSVPASKLIHHLHEWSRQHTRVLQDNERLKNENVALHDNIARLEHQLCEVQFRATAPARAPQAYIPTQQFEYDYSWNDPRAYKNPCKTDKFKPIGKTK